MRSFSAKEDIIMTCIPDSLKKKRQYRCSEKAEQKDKQRIIENFLSLTKSSFSSILNLVCY